MAKPWWQEPFGLPPALEARVVAQNGRDLRRGEVLLYRLYFPLFPVVGLVGALAFDQYGSLLLTVALPVLQWLGLPDRQRRQVLGRPPR